MLQKVYISTLGCSKNLVDSEAMLGLLNPHGIQKVNSPEEADFAIVNTCGFIEAAKEESIKEILELAAYKKTTGMKYLIVTGCLAQRYESELKADLPEVDAFLGTTSFEKIYEVVQALDHGKKTSLVYDTNYPVEMSPTRQRLTESFTAFLKIAEGCDNRCTYCIIPKLRGNYRSRALEDIVAEGKALAEEGVREIILIAQDTSKYGLDRYGKKSLAKLLIELNKIEGLHWIRFLYTYPEDIDQELVLAVKDSPKVCPYFDMPIQHCSDNVLRRMNRKTTKQELESKIALIRKEIPGAILRTTLITGFPGETEAEFQEMREFISRIGFDRLGVFAYSQEEDTPAAKMPDQISETVKERRREELMLIQQEISKRKNEQMVGRSVEVLLERKTEKGIYEGRTVADVPEIDGIVFVHTAKNHRPGTFVPVQIRDFLEYDLIGDEVDEHCE